MSLTIAPEIDLESLAAVVEHRSLQEEFEPWQGRVAAACEDPFHPAELTWIARDQGAPVAFALAYVLPSTPGRFAQVRIGVIDSHRRLGLGSQLLDTAVAALHAGAPDCREISLVAWVPNVAAERFAARHGFAHARSFWLMERPRGHVPDTTMPPSIELRAFDGSEAALRDLNDAYNASFAQHYHFVRTTVDDTRALVTRAGFRRDALALAYRGGHCVGFCRNELFANRGEIAVLGTVPEARRIGLGRALLRWGVAWLEIHDAPRITLLVDGDNEQALVLYLSEEFHVARTREVWAKPGPGRS